MSAPDARLNAAERAALADLEAAAERADPALATRLKGGRRTTPAFDSMRVRLLRGWLTVVRARHLAAPFCVLGLLLIVLGLSGGIAVSVIGTVILVAGLRIAVEFIPDLAGRHRD